MNNKYLVINAGSSSLKFSLYEMPNSNEIVNGYIEKIGNQDSFYTLKYNEEKVVKNRVILNHLEAVEVMINELLENHFISNVNEIIGVGHRIAHGGEYYTDSVIIDDEVIKNIASLIKLAPLHQPANLTGIKEIQKAIPTATQIAVFDTAFHQTMPEVNYIYPVPYSWYKENEVRKYGFHGTSHKYITENMQEYFNKEDVNLIICHIGSGASMSCIKNGKSYNTTMGLTPLDGLMMGTRSGAVDPSIIEYICKERNMTVEEVTSILNKESGLKGISSKNDLRDVEKLIEQDNYNAKLALKLLEKSIINFIAQYYFELEGNVDAIIFTAGIGENVPYLREDIVNFISKPMGIKINKEANNNIAKFKQYQSGVITTEDSKIKVVVIPTNEEYMILKDTYNLSKKLEKQKILKK